MANIRSARPVSQKPRPVVLFFVLGSLFLVACSGGSSGSGDVLETSGTLVPEADQRIIPTEDVRPYKPAGNYAAVLKDCIVVQEDPCTLETLPYIGQEHPSPSISNIMDRVLVTHDWMGERFENLLAAMPAESLALFKPVTAVLIGSDVRPSSYSSTFGRIRLDPKNLWLSNSEKLTISQAADYRDEYGAVMKFDAYWRMVKDGEYAWGSSNLTGTNERQLDDILLPMSRLVFHELAHANDFIQDAIYPSLVPSDTPASAREKNSENSIATRLYDEALGLSDNSSWLYAFARTRYRDDELNPDLHDFTAADAGAIMETEGKTTFYGYLTIQEDVATLFAQSMMRRFYNVESHVALVDKPVDVEDVSCDDYIIGWGTVNRPAAPLVRVRGEWVMKQMLGESAAIDNFYERIGFESSLPVGTAWCRAVNVELADTLQRSDGVAPTMKEVRDYERSLFEPHQW